MLISYVDPQTLPASVLLLRGSLEGALTRSSPAAGAMTDFSTETPARVVPGRHIMTPWAQLRLLDYYQVTMASAGDLADQFRGTDTTHVLVIERSAVGAGQVRGLISMTRLLRQLGPQNDESRGITH